MTDKNEAVGREPVEPETLRPDNSDHSAPFVLRDARYGKGGGVPGVNPDDWMSIKHLVRGAGG